MAEINDVYGSIYQNLLNTGFDTHTAAQCMGIVKEGRHSDILPVLSMHRQSLLDSLHAGQRKIDCLDFLIYKLKKYEK